MGINGLFSQNVILETGMQALHYKNGALMQNLANVDTPNYKRKTVNFENTLSEAIDKTKGTGENHMGTVMPSLSFSEKRDSTTLDGNSVDMETEMIELYKNSARYEAVANSVMSNSNITSSVYAAFK